MADVLTSLTEAQWAKPSLCTGWAVRDVAAGLGRPGRSARVGSAPAMVGTAVFFMAALASIPINDQRMDEPAKLIGSSRLLGSLRPYCI